MRPTVATKQAAVRRVAKRIQRGHLTWIPGLPVTDSFSEEYLMSLNPDSFALKLREDESPGVVHHAL